MFQNYQTRQRQYTQQFCNQIYNPFFSMFRIENVRRAYD